MVEVDEDALSNVNQFEAYQGLFIKTMSYGYSRRTVLANYVQFEKETSVTRAIWPLSLSLRYVRQFILADTGKGRVQAKGNE